MCEKKVRIGFVGVGMMGQNAHLRNYVTVPDCEVVAIAEVHKDTAHKVAAAYGINKVYVDYKEMLQNEQLDAVVASQPFRRHGILVTDLLSYGIPVFTEKPLAGSIAVGEKILEAAKKQDSWMMIGYHKRSDPATMFVKDEIKRLEETGELGKMTYVRLLMPEGNWVANGNLWQVKGNDSPVEFQCDPLATDMDQKTYDLYISFVNYYIHQVNLMRHLLGEAYRLNYADRSGVILVGESDSGKSCVIEMSPYQTSQDWQESAFVCFERGWIKLELPAPLSINRPGKVTMFREGVNGQPPQFIEPVLPMIHAMRQQAINFTEAVKNNTAPLCGVEEALEDLKIAREYIRLRYER